MENLYFMGFCFHSRTVCFTRRLISDWHSIKADECFTRSSRLKYCESVVGGIIEYSVASSVQCGEEIVGFVSTGGCEFRFGIYFPHIYSSFDFHIYSFFLVG